MSTVSLPFPSMVPLFLEQKELCTPGDQPWRNGCQVSGQGRVESGKGPGPPSWDWIYLCLLCGDCLDQAPQRANGLAWPAALLASLTCDIHAVKTPLKIWPSSRVGESTVIWENESAKTLTLPMLCSLLYPANISKQGTETYSALDLTRSTSLSCVLF